VEETRSTALEMAEEKDQAQEESRKAVGQFSSAH